MEGDVTTILSEAKIPNTQNVFMFIQHRHQARHVTPGLSLGTCSNGPDRVPQLRASPLGRGKGSQTPQHPLGSSTPGPGRGGSGHELWAGPERAGSRGDAPLLSPPAPGPLFAVGTNRRPGLW